MEVVNTDFNTQDLKCSLSREITNEGINDLIIKLVSIPDVISAGILGKDGSVLLWQSRNCTEPTSFSSQLSDYIYATRQNNSLIKRNGMFTYSIYSYNGNNILFRGIDDNFLLMFVLDKRAFIGITMLDIEGCLFDINMIMNDAYNKFHKTPA